MTPSTALVMRRLREADWGGAARTQIRPSDCGTGLARRQIPRQGSRKRPHSGPFASSRLVEFRLQALHLPADTSPNFLFRVIDERAEEDQERHDVEPDPLARFQMRL